MEFRPTNWVIGFMLGSQLSLSFINTTNKTNTPTFQIVQNSLTTGASGNIGMFIPLPNDYRLDFSLASANGNLLQFGQLRLQLIVHIK